MSFANMVRAANERAEDGPTPNRSIHVTDDTTLFFALAGLTARKATIHIDPRAKPEPPPGVQPPVEQEDVF